MTATKYPYYEDQENWTNENYYYLFRYLNRMFLNKNNDRLLEIKSIDICKVSNDTRALMCSIIEAQNNYEYYKFENLKGLKYTERLKESLYLTENPRNIYKSFEKYNVKL